MSVDPSLEFVVKVIAETAVEKEKEFGDLDAVVGDGDFGYSLARGFEIVVAEWDDIDRSSSAVFLQKIALIISKRVGGTSGPIWGTAFLRASAAVKDVEELTPEHAVAMLRAAAEGIKKRGSSDLGDKTLLDALIPMTDALEAALGRSRRRVGRAGRDRCGNRAYGRRCHVDDAGDARTSQLHRRTQHRLPRCRSSRGRGAGRARRRALAASRPRPSQPSDQREQHKGVDRMKKFVNDPKNFVSEMLEGLALANPERSSTSPSTT